MKIFAYSKQISSGVGTSYLDSSTRDRVLENQSTEGYWSELRPVQFNKG